MLHNLRQTRCLIVPRKYFSTLTVVKYLRKTLITHYETDFRYVYDFMLSELERKPNTVNWASNVKDLLSSMGYYEVWIAQGVGNKNAFLSDMKTRLKDNFVQNWSSRIDDSDRAF